MSETHNLSVLVSQIDNSRAVLERINSYYDEFTGTKLDRTSPSREDAIVLSEILVNYYTALETVFLRVSQTFENSLSPGRWHHDLLDRMILEIPDVRPRVLSEACHASLRELMRFRHFKRYYFEFDYDWDKLMFLEKKYRDARDCVRTDLRSFIDRCHDAGT